MGEKKKKEAEVAVWKKAVVVGACVLFVFLMIISGMGSGWLSMFSSVKSGDTVVVDYTLYDSAGSPIVTTDQQVYTSVAKAGGDILYGRQLTLVANKSISQAVYPVDVYIGETGLAQEFAIFAPEYNTISSSVVGMKANEKKKITLMSSATSQFWSSETLQNNGISMDDVSVGSIVAMGVSSNPNASATNSSEKTYLRVAEVVRKVPTGVTVDFGYPTAEIKVVSFGSAN